MSTTKHKLNDEDLSELDRDTRSDVKRHKKLLKSAISSKNHDEESKICNALGEMLSVAGMLTLALRYHMQDLEISSKYGSKISVSIAHRMVGEVYSEMGEFEAAIDHQKKYLQITLEEKNLVEQQRAYATLGRTCYTQMMSEPDSSPLKKIMRKQTGEYYQLSIRLTSILREQKLVTEREVLQMRCRLYLNIGLLYDKHTPAMSLEYLERAAKKSQELRDWGVLHLALVQLVETHTLQKDFNQALRYSEQAVQAAKLSDIKSNYSEALQILSQTHLVMGNMMMAQSTSRQALHLSPDTGPAMLVYKCAKLTMDAQQEDFGCGSNEIDQIAKIGSILIKLSMPQQALLWLEKQLMMPQENELDSLDEIHGKLASCYVKLDDFEMSLHHYREQLRSTDHPCPVWIKLAHLYLQHNDPFETCLDAAQAGLSEVKTVSEQSTCYHCIIEIAEHFEKEDIAENAKKELSELDLGDSMTCTDSQADSLGDISDIDVSDEEDVQDPRRTDKKLTKVNEKGETPLHQAAITGNVNKVRELLSKHASPNTRDNAGWTPLHEACNHGFLEIVELLVTAGADINDRGGKECGGTTPLHDAVMWNFVDIVHFLLSQGANVLAQDEEHFSCLDHVTAQLESEPDDLVKQQLKEILEEAMKNPQKLAPSKRVDVTEVFESDIREPLVTTSGPNYKASKLCTQMQPQQHSVAQAVRTNRSRSLPSALTRDKSAKSRVRHSDMQTKPPDDWLEEVPHSSSKRRKIVDPFVGSEKRKNSFSGNNKILKQTKLTVTIMSDDSEASPPLEPSIITDEPLNKTVEHEPKVIRVKVRVNDKLFLIPVQSKQTICELALLAANRYHAEVGLLPRLKLTTSEGALLADNDPACLILNDGDDIVGVMEELERQPLPEQYKTVCDRMGLEPVLLDKLSNHATVVNLSRQNVAVNHLECLFTTILCFTPLTEINIAYNRLTPDLVNSLSAALPNLPGLVAIDISCCGLGPKSFSKLCEVLMKEEDKKKLKKFSCDYNHFVDAIEIVLKLAIRLSLEYLSAKSCHLSGPISPTLSSQFSTCKLITLDLRQNHLTQIPLLPSSLLHLSLGGAELTNLSFPPNLVSLTLERCHLTDTSVVSHLSTLTSITSLSVPYNKITSAECVIELLMLFPGLTYLDLTGNSIGSAGVEEIGLVAPSTLSVILQGCSAHDLTSETITMLAQGLKSCDLSYNDVNFPRLSKSLEEGVRAKFNCRGSKLLIEM